MDGHNTRRVIAALIVSLCFMNCAYAVVLVSEPFNYASGALGGDNGGVGFGAPWTSDTVFSVISGSLAVGDYAGTGNSLHFSSSHLTSFSAGRNLNATYATSGSDIWASYLVRVDSLNAYAGVSYNTSGVSFSGVFVGILGGPSGVGPPSSTWGMDTTGGTGVVLSNVPVVYGQPTLLVVHMTEQSGVNRFDLYVNPPVNLPFSPDATKTMSNWTFNHMSCNIDYGTGVFDEIRLGTTYADVRPVPEPCVGLLLAVGGMALLLRRLYSFFSHS